MAISSPSFSHGPLTGTARGPPNDGVPAAIAREARQRAVTRDRAPTS